MRQFRTSGSVRGVAREGDSYGDRKDKPERELAHFDNSQNVKMCSRINWLQSRSDVLTDFDLNENQRGSALIQSHGRGAGLCFTFLANHAFHEFFLLLKSGSHSTAASSNRSKRSTASLRSNRLGFLGLGAGSSTFREFSKRRNEWRIPAARRV
jgi:hypothetical protein